MIRIRVKPNHITIRIDGGPKQHYTSAIHALHVIRVAVIESGQVTEGTSKTQQALQQCLTRARDELGAAIADVTEGPRKAVCVVRQADGQVERSYYQTTDKRHLYVVRRGGTAVYEGKVEQGNRVQSWSEAISADVAMERMGYIVAPC